MAGNDVRVVIVADGGQAIRTLKDVGDTAHDSQSKLGKMGGALGDVAKIAGGFVVAQGLMQMPKLLGGLVGGASDLNESLSKARTVFGENAAEIERWAGTAAKAFGQSKQQALEAAGTFGNFLQAMGQTPAKAADMSKAMVQLAADLGSFNNADPTEVLLALRSGLSGEAEPMRKFGVALSEAAVQAKGAQLGLGKLGKEMTEQEKITARYAIIMEQTKMAQGDFARTSEGHANQMKILKAQFADVRNEVGTALLPVILKLGQVMLDHVLPAVKAVIDIVLDFGRYIKAVVADGDTLNDWLSHLPGFLQPVARLIGEISLFIKDALIPAMSDAINWIGEMAGVLAGQLTPAISDLWSHLRELDFSKLKTDLVDVKAKLEPMIEVLRPLVDDLMQAWKSAIDDVAEAMRPLLDELEKWEPILKPLAVVIGSVLVVVLAAFLVQIRLIAEAIRIQLLVAITALTVGLEAVRETVGFVRDAFDSLNERFGIVEKTIWIAREAVYAIRDAFFAVRDAVWAVIGAIDSLISKIPSIPSMPDISPGFDVPGVPKFATGGIVPGPIGKPVLAVVHGGEEVIPNGQRTGTSVVVHVYGSVLTESDLLEVIQRQLNRQMA